MTSSINTDLSKKLTVGPRRTYLRKRPEYHEIPDAEHLCRLCLIKCDSEKATPIFTDDGILPNSLALRIMICVGLELKKDENLPNQVCLSCLNELQRCYEFRKRCETSYLKLKSHIIAKQMKNHKKEELHKKENELLKKAIDDAPNAYIYMVNVDSKISVCGEGEIPNKSEQDLLTVPLKEDYKESPLQIAEATQSENNENLNSDIMTNSETRVENTDTSSCTEFLNIQKIRKDKVNENSVTTQSITEIILDSKSDILKKFEEVHSIDDQTKSLASNDEISKFLIDVLSKMGVLVRQEDSLVVADEIPRVEVETGDGVEVVMEIVEDDEPEACTEITPAILYVKAKDREKEEEFGPMSRRCGECGRTFSCVSAARRHWRAAHRRHRPYKCRHCARAFAQKEVCLRHEGIHKETRAYACLRCGKSYTQRSGLRAHVRSHEPPQRRAHTLHPCPVCHKLFLHQSGVSRHMNSHTGRQFICGCGRHYSDLCSLKRHCKAAGHQPAPEHTAEDRRASVDPVIGMKDDKIAVEDSKVDKEGC